MHLGDGTTVSVTLMTSYRFVPMSRTTENSDAIFPHLQAVKSERPIIRMAQHSRAFVFYKENWTIFSHLQAVKCAGRGWMAWT